MNVKKRDTTAKSLEQKKLAARAAADKVKKWRVDNGLASFSVDLPIELIAEFDKYRRFKDKTRREVIEKLIRTQLLRKR